MFSDDMVFQLIKRSDQLNVKVHELDRFHLGHAHSTDALMVFRTGLDIASQKGLIDNFKLCLHKLHGLPNLYHQFQQLLIAFKFLNHNTKIMA